MKKKLLWDAGLLLFCLVLAGTAFAVMQLTKTSGSYAVVYVDGQETARYPLAQDTRVVLGSREAGYNVLVIRDGAASVEEADCPEGLCIRQRAISRLGETIVCLPHRVVIEITGNGRVEVDV